MFGKTSIWDDIKYQFRYGGMHIRLIIINITVFLIAHLILLFGDKMMGADNGTHLLNKFCAEASLHSMLYKPWAYFTYMFVHTGIFHILFNMLILYTFAGVIKEFIGNSKILPLFILGGLSGVFLMALSYNLIPYFSEHLHLPMMGASAGVMAILLAAATLVPDYTLFLMLLGPVKIKWIALFYILIDIVMINISNNEGGHIAHLGGAIFGIVYIRQLQRGNDLGLPIYWLEDQWEKLTTPKPKMEVSYRREEKVSAGKVSSERNSGNQQKSTLQNQVSKQEQLDNILDKINRSGYDSLTKAEKDFLFKISQED